MAQDQPLRSVYTSNLPDILKQLNISLAVSTYQAGRVILVRYEENEDSKEGVINTHFRYFDKPMGICLKDDRLCIGGTHTVWEYRNVPATAGKLEPPSRHDACYVPRGIHFTGNIDIHEMNWSRDDELWLVNTRFSCLCTLDRDHSFIPRWRPGFVSALSPEDRCHLNGMAMRDGVPRYVTALGETNSRGGWRANKVSGGILMDVGSGEVMLRGLSMPHSPRWYRNQLWLLESGKGALSLVDEKQGTIKTIATVPGFTRGIDFVGPLAFIGLSKVRETAVFSGLPITKDHAERSCGVWVVNIETGETLGFLRFESDVAEIFAVQVLPGMRYPEMLPSDAPLVAETYVLPDEALAEVELPTQQEFESTPHFFMAEGTRHFTQQAYEQAITAFRHCLELQADFPNARYGLGIALAEVGQWEEALEHLEAVREKEPDRSEVQLSLGTLYQRMGAVEKARTAYEAAVIRQPDNAVAHLSLGVLLLQLGDFGKGLEEYEWRLKTGQVPVPRTSHPVWDGKPAPDKTLLVYLEQDDPRRAILLMRYLPEVAKRCGKLIVASPELLMPLLGTLPGIVELRKPGQVSVSEFDVQVSLDSLPLVLGVRPDSILQSIPYLDCGAVQKRADKVLALKTTDKRKVGVAWSNSLLDTGQAKGLNRHSACPIQEIGKILAVENIEFYPVSVPSNEAEAFRSLKQKWAENPLTEKSTLADLALVVDQLDLVIGVDSPALHLAAAMGKPTWAMLGTVYDWYWSAEGAQSAWYPDVRIIRQPAPGDWAGLVANVCSELEAWRETV